MGTSDIKFLGVDFKIPERPEEYLTCNYGSDWSIPVRNWNYFESPPNLRVAIDRINESEAARRFDHWLNE